MGCSVDLENLTGVDVGVSLRGGETRMAQKLLNGTEIGTSPQQVRRKAVAERMGADLGSKGEGPNPIGH